MIEILRTFAFIFIAEMGDKSQILAMAFATKYSVKKVLLGIFIGVFLNHGLAVLLGNSLTKIIPSSYLQITAGLAFILFALWSLKMNDDEESLKKKVRYGPVVTVAIAFFLGELGDKTQLTAITLSLSSEFPLYVLIGSVLGMVVTGALGIYVGIKLGNKVPEFFIKLGASIVFFTFGLIKLFSSLPTEYLKAYFIIPFIILILIIAYVIIKPSLEHRKEGKITLFKKTAENLHSFYNDLSVRIEDICLGENVCGECEGINCLIGYTKSLIRNAEKGITTDVKYIENLNNRKSFNKQKVYLSLKLTIEFLKDHPKIEEDNCINQVRKNFETILFGTYIEKFENYEKYKLELIRIDKNCIIQMNLS
jgi:putative Ca2+/H+ antiporter (TMEM165/GDT1 family)